MTSGCRPKLETQLARIGNPTDDDWICTSRVSVVLGDRMKTWPRQLMRDHDRVTAYVARKPHLRGRGFIQASTLVFPRTLGLRVPFDHQQRFHQDVDWLVSVDEQVMDLRVYQCPRSAHRVLGRRRNGLWAHHSQRLERMGTFAPRGRPP